eukprot:307885_1
MALMYVASRTFSSKPKLTIIKKGILRYINVSKLNRNLKQSLFDIEEKQMTDDMMKNPLAYDHNYFVGDFENDMVEYANVNLSKFAKEHLSTSRARKGWTCPKQIQQEIGIPVTTTVDYHPFPFTFPPKKIPSKKHKSTWSVDKSHQYCQLSDSMGVNMPFLTRKNPNDTRTKQQLLIWRDIHPDIKNIFKIKDVISEYQPDTIIIEYPPEGTHLMSYISPIRKMLAWILNFRARFVKDEATCKIGKKLPWRKFGLTTSYAVDAAIMLAINQKIPIVLSDYRGPTKNLLGSAAKALDGYCMIHWLLLGFPAKEMCEMTEKALLPEQLTLFTLLRLQPHFYVMVSHRNDMMSLAINENTERKILFMCGAGHSRYIMDRLCGNVQINNPFKDINEKRVLLKDFMAYNYVGDKTALDASDIEFVTNTFGEEVARIMLLDNHQLNGELLQQVVSKCKIPENELNQLQKDYNLNTKKNSCYRRRIDSQI